MSNSVAATSLAGHTPLWIDLLCCLTSGPVKLLSWEKNARYRSFSWTENSDLQSVHFRLRKVPFQQHFPLCTHGCQSQQPWVVVQVLGALGAWCWAGCRGLELLGAVSWVQRTPCSGFCNKGAEMLLLSDSSLCSCWKHFCKALGRVTHHWITGNDKAISRAKPQSVLCPSLHTREWSKCRLGRIRCSPEEPGPPGSPRYKFFQWSWMSLLSGAGVGNFLWLLLEL